MNSSLNGGNRGGASKLTSSTPSSKAKRVANRNRRLNRNNRGNGRKTLESAPVSQQYALKIGKPVVTYSSGKNGDGKIRVRHREYIQDIPGSVAFSSTSFAVNPGISTTFPWLSSLAILYESYKFLKLKFEYETEKATTVNGSLMMGVDYDAADSAPTNKTVLMSFHDAVRSAVWSECCFNADKQDLDKFGVHRFVRPGALASNLDIKTYDVGNLFVGTQGCADTTAIGELYVEYDVELETPQIGSAAIALANSASVISSTSTRAAPLTGAVVAGGLPVVITNTTTLTFNKVGQYLLDLFIVGTVTTATAPTLTGTGATVLLNPGSAQLVNAGVTVGGDSWTLNVLNPGETVIFDLTASCTTCTSFILRIGAYALANG